MNKAEENERINEGGPVEVKENERINEGGPAEVKVETVDYRSTAGEDDEPKKEKVVVTHIPHTDDQTDNGKTGKVVADVAAAVTSKIESAKEAISGKGSDNKNTK